MINIITIVCVLFIVITTVNLLWLYLKEIFLGLNELGRNYRKGYKDGYHDAAEKFGHNIQNEVN